MISRPYPPDGVAQPVIITHMQLPSRRRPSLPPNLHYVS
jgi:hypothetical protein